MKSHLIYEWLAVKNNDTNEKWLIFFPRHVNLFISKLIKIIRKLLTRFTSNKILETVDGDVLPFFSEEKPRGPSTEIAGKTRKTYGEENKVREDELTVATHVMYIKIGRSKPKFTVSFNFPVPYNYIFVLKRKGTRNCSRYCFQDEEIYLWYFYVKLK